MGSGRLTEPSAPLFSGGELFEESYLFHNYFS